jgi:3-isopropylmalate/(R)-2-methylmalate dehydratase small subunit
MPQYSFEYYPGKENFAKEVKRGDFVVAGKNFGCGSSREHAVYCLKEAGIPVILAGTCSRIYYRNAINNGYPVLFIKGISDAIKNGAIKDGDELEVELETGTIKDRTNGKTFHGDAVSDLERDIMASGGLIPYLKAQKETGR